MCSQAPLAHFAPGDKADPGHLCPCLTRTQGLRAAASTGTFPSGSGHAAVRFPSTPPVEAPLKTPANFAGENVPLHTFASRQRSKRGWYPQPSDPPGRAALLGHRQIPADGPGRSCAVQHTDPAPQVCSGSPAPGTQPQLRRAKLSYLHRPTAAPTAFGGKRELTAEEGDAPFDQLIDAACRAEELCSGYLSILLPSQRSLINACFLALADTRLQDQMLFISQH